MSGGKHVKDMISAYIDGNLDVRRHAEVEAHLRGCPDCKRLLDELNAARAAVHALPRPQAPADLAHRILEKVAPEPASGAERASQETRPAPRMVFRWVTVGAACVLGFLFVRDMLEQKNQRLPGFNLAKAKAGDNARGNADMKVSGPQEQYVSEQPEARRRMASGKISVQAIMPEMKSEQLLAAKKSAPAKPAPESYQMAMAQRSIGSSGGRGYAPVAPAMAVPAMQDAADYDKSYNAASPAEEPAPYYSAEKEISGIYSTNPEQYAGIIKDERSFRDLWKTHGIGALPPDVDFSKEMVVAVFLGRRPTLGYSVSITETSPGKFVYEEIKPSRDAIAGQAITYPYKILIVPRRSGATIKQR